MGSELLVVAPSVFILFVWLLFFFQDALLKYIPNLPFVTHYASKAISVKLLLPLNPKNKYLAFLCGRLDAELQFYENKTDSESAAKVEDILQRVANLFGRSSITKQELQAVEETILAYERDQGIVRRVRGFFSFVNIIWLISIFGICVSVYPVIADFAPIFANYLIRVFKEVIIPMLELFEPVYEYLAYFVCYVFVANGLKIKGPIGFFVSLTGSMGFIPSFVYSTHLHSTKNGDEVLYARIFSSFICAQLIPVAILHNSTLMGTLAAAAFFAFMGFSVVGHHLCIYIGFKDEETMQVIFVASVLIMVTIFLLKLFNFSPKYVKPFAPGLMTFGAIAYFLAGLIMSSLYYHCPYNYTNHMRHCNYSLYFIFQVIMISSFLVSFLASTLFTFPPLYNTACTFLVLFLHEKLFDLGYNHTGLGWYYVLATSLLMYAVSLFLYRHPRFIITMFDGPSQTRSAKTNIA